MFGSRVRGENRPDSDLDIVLDFEAVPSTVPSGELDALLAERTGPWEKKGSMAVPRTCLHPALKDQIRA